MSVILRSLRLIDIRHQVPRFRSQRQHILAQRHHLRPLFRVILLLEPRRIAGIQIDRSVIINKNSRIKLLEIALPVTERHAVLMLYQPQELIFPGRGVTDGNRNLRQIVQTIVQIVSAVQSLHHIRCPHGMNTWRIQGIFILYLHAESGLIGRRICRNILISGILFLSIDDSLIAPVRKILHVR